MYKQNLLDIILLSDKQRSHLYDLIDQEETIYTIDKCDELFLLEHIEENEEDESDYHSIEFCDDSEDWIEAAILYVQSY